MTERASFAAQHTLLITHRQTLQVLLGQKAQFGAAYAPPVVIHGIKQARAEIAKIKQYLRTHGEQVSDAPEDEENLETPISLSQSVHNGIDALIQMLPSPNVRASAIEFRKIFEQAGRQIQIVNFYKRLHDEFQELEVLLYRLEDDYRQIERGGVDWDDLTIFEEIADKVDDLYTLVPDDAKEWWVQRLQAAMADMRVAVTHQDCAQVNAVITQISRVLNRLPTRVNTQLVSAAEALLFTELTDALSAVSKNLNCLGFESSATSDIEVSIQALATLNELLQQSVRNHQQWQTIDDELRRVESNLRTDISELELAWPDLQMMTVNTYGNSSADWALTLTQMWSDLESALTNRVLDKVRPQFRKYRRRASRRFRQVDDELLGLCNGLEKVGASLNLLLKAL